MDNTDHDLELAPYSPPGPVGSSAEGSARPSAGRLPARVRHIVTSAATAAVLLGTASGR